MTDNEIIKALECCGEDGDGCTGCPRLNAEFGATITSCSAGLATNALSLIHRQKAEIERLQAERKANFDGWKKRGDELASHYEEMYKTAIATIRPEAIKEFAERLHTEILQALESNYRARAERERKTFNFAEDALWSYCSGKVHCLDGLKRFVNDLVKEMVGDDNAND